MSKLEKYIVTSKFPVKRTGKGSEDDEFKSYVRIKKKLTYFCSLCNCAIRPNDFLELMYGFKEFVAPSGHSEVVGFICEKCSKEISDYETLSYG